MNTSNLDGVLLVDKPRGITSHDVIARLRRLLGVKKIGHVGTLDPMATGLLIVLIGRTTKISQYLVDLSKGYKGTMKLGISTDSHDMEGKILESHDVKGVSLKGLKNLADEFLGDQYQMPPMFSAKKVNGQKLYKLARKGKTVDREPQFIRISAFKIDNLRNDEVDFFVQCSKGTYVRTLVNDFGERLKCGAHLSQLCRTTIGDFSINDALTMEEISQTPIFELSKRLIPAYDVVPSRVMRVT
ncbi:MAG: tRNA pseudouridine(55) synthase TruB [Puniceicoccales bacterium]|nr:tRNA pseudouridine(55) synthase TruB [Puniceicoccales bacterium]